MSFLQQKCVHINITDTVLYTHETTIPLLKIYFVFKFWILVQSLTSAAGGINTIWFFEKEADNLNDNTPKYEGIIVDYDQKISVSDDNNI